VKVRKLSPSKKHYTVTFLFDDDSSATFLASEDLVVEYRLIPGKILEDFVFQAFQRAVLIDEAFQKALAYGIKYPQTTAGMTTYLRGKAVSEPAIADILGKLEKLRVLDDEAYVKSYIDHHLRSRHEGTVKIVYELKHKGLASELIAKYIEPVSMRELQAGMSALLDSKLASLRDKPVQKALMLMTHHLVEKGYDRDQAEAFVQSHRSAFHQASEDEALIQKDYVTTLRHLEKQNLAPRDLKEKIIRSLMNKGYPYALIKKQLERGQSDEREDVGI